jgi:hypothetical protein
MSKISLLSKYFIKKYAQVDQALESPNVIVQPSEPLINKAIQLLKRMDPNYFKGVRQIQVSPASMYFGFVESGPNKDPAILNINMGKIKGLGQGSEAVIQAALTVAHEAAHTKSYDQQQGFVGGENPAEAEEQKVSNWIEQNKGRLQDLLL